MTTNRRHARTHVPGRAFLRPLVMLAAGIAAGAVLWRTLMLEPSAPTSTGAEAEQLSAHDRQALDRLLEHRP
jgi:hypothetical protein